jgi:hypothetical protein
VNTERSKNQFIEIKKKQHNYSLDELKEKFPIPNWHRFDSAEKKLFQNFFCCPPSQIVTSIEEGQIWADVAFYFMPDV